MNIQDMAHADTQLAVIESFGALLALCLLLAAFSLGCYVGARWAERRLRTPKLRPLNFTDTISQP